MSKEPVKLPDEGRSSRFGSLRDNSVEGLLRDLLRVQNLNDWNEVLARAIGELWLKESSDDPYRRAEIEKAGIKLERKVLAGFGKVGHAGKKINRAYDDAYILTVFAKAKTNTEAMSFLTDKLGLTKSQAFSRLKGAIAHAHLKLEPSPSGFPPNAARSRGREAKKAPPK